MGWRLASLFLFLAGTAYCFSSVERRHPRTVLKQRLPTAADETAATARFPDTPVKREETPEDLLLQGLWEKEPFTVAAKVVETIIVSDHSNRPLLTMVESSSLPPLLEEHQRLFHRLFGATSKANTTDVNTTVAPENGKASYKLELAYMGESFCGWQTQPGNHQRPSVQQTLEDWLQPLYQPSRRVLKKKRNHQESKPARVNLRVAGRTDAGVNAIGQVARFRTWTKGGGDSQCERNATSLLEHINQHALAGTAFSCLSATPVSPQFHPTFGATGRAYLYLMDAHAIQDQFSTMSLPLLVDRLNELLQPLEQQEHDYVAMSYGRIKTQTTLCRLAVARAVLVQTNGTPPQEALGIQLVGDRFLRRMVRILVATALREALQEENDLVGILQSKDRSKAARPAPPQGLIFVAASFEE